MTSLPAAVDSGFDSPAGRRLLITLVWMGGVLVADELVASARTLVRADLYRRYEEHLLARVMAAVLGAPRLELFEDPAHAGKVRRVAMLAESEPGDLVDGLAEKWAAQVQGLAGAILVGTVQPIAAFMLAAVWILVGRQLQAAYQRHDPSGSTAHRRSRYFWNLGLMPAWAKEVRIFGLVGWIADQFSHQWQVVMSELAVARRIGKRTRTVLLVLVITTNAVVALWAASAAIEGRLSPGALTVLVQGMVAVVLLADQKGDLLIGWGAGHVPQVMDVERAAAALEVGSDGTVTAGGLPRHDITLERLTFAYPGRDSPVYDNLDLRIEAGRSLAIVGLNGAGKTTLAKLTAGLELPSQGTIRIDGIDLADLDLLSWRRNVAAIFQDFVHYDLPARDNIGFGAVESLGDVGAGTDVDAEVDERILAVARRAGADGILAGLPDGLSTPLSPAFAGGVDLSGGQWQRIALTRALFAVEAGARVLILDEPTAHLDVRAEADLYERFIEVTRGLTTIVISHRFSTVRRADRIVVIDDGRIVEDGTHAQLVAAGGEYARLFAKQAMRYDTASEPESDND